jgi:prepilin-type N-terminal cleavage/methylation domain-containing protein
MRSNFKSKRCAFSLVEVTIVVVILGVLAAFGVPRLIRSVERTKAAEAFQYLSAVRAAQESFASRQGSYTATLTDLEVEQAAPKYFTVGTMGVGSSGTLETSWTLTLTRSGSSGGYGAYTVTYNQSGYDSANSTIEAQPAINPRGTK